MTRIFLIPKLSNNSESFHVRSFQVSGTLQPEYQILGQGWGASVIVASQDGDLTKKIGLWQSTHADFINETWGL